MPDGTTSYSRDGSFQLDANGAACACEVWVCRNEVEEDIVEDRVGPVDPGKAVIWPPAQLPLLPDVPAAKWPQIVEHCTFDWMKAHGDKVVPLGGAGWNGGSDTFLHKGTNGRWKDVLSSAESARFEDLMRDRLGPECARWLATGEGA